MKNWTIGKRVIFGFASVLILTFVIAGLSTQSLRRIEASNCVIVEDSMPSIVLLGRIVQNVSQNQISLLRHLMTHSPEKKEEFAKDVLELSAVISTEMSQFAKLDMTPEENELLK